MWGYEWNGTGILPNGPTPIDLAYGLAFHDAADVIIEGAGWKEAYELGRRRLDDITAITVDGLPAKEEYSALLYGHVRAFGEFIAPSIHARFEILARETEMALALSDDLIYMARLDLGVRDKVSGLVYNFEYKTDASPSDIYQRMEFHLQMMLESACMSEHMKETCHGSIVLGIEKGAHKGPSPTEKQSGLTSGERRLSPFTYAYRKGDEYRIDYTAAKGWERFPVWTLKGGAGEWYERMTDDLGFDPSSQFVETLPIAFDEARWASVKRQIIAIEARLADGVGLQASGKFPQLQAEAVDEYFPQNFSNCKNDGGFRRQCAFVDLCHFAGDPSDASRWTPRTANHPLEVTIKEANAG